MEFFLHAAGEQPINKHFIHIERHLYSQELISCTQRNIIVWVQNGYGEIYWSVEDIEKLKKESKKFKDWNVAQKILSDSAKKIEEYWHVVNEALNKLKKPIKRYELAQIYDKYYNALRDVLIFFPATSDKMTFAVERELKEIIKTKYHGDYEGAFITLTTPAEPDILYYELNDWAKIIKKPGTPNIISHTRKYSILLPNTFSEDDALAWAKHRLKKKSLREIQQTILGSELKRIDIEKKQKELLSQLKSEEADRLSFFMRRAAIIRLQLKACWNGESYHMLPLYEKIAKIAGIPVKNLYMFYFWREISNLLHNGIELTKIHLQKRKKCYLLRLYDWEINLFSGKKAEEMKKTLLEPYLPDKNLEIFRGTIANKGRVAGIAKVVRTDNPSEFQKLAKSLTKEHILVTSMTNPAITVFLDKLKGIITDEGGTASHAAIISREFNIPCIVGCRVATQILNDGEYILLDADKGEVKRINKEEYNNLKSLKTKPKEDYWHEEKIKPKLDIKKIKAQKTGNVIWLKDITKGDIGIVGGKGANLGELYPKFKVPNGFCITVAPYFKFSKEKGLDEQIRVLSGNLDINDSQKLDTISKNIRNQIINKEFPGHLRKEIIDNYNKLKNKKVAVRSSATAEDLPTASFAGQHDTFLDITGEEQLIDAVKKCWASLFTARAVYYRARNNFNHESALMSIVVQEMIDADFAGVVFTIDPVNKKHILIEVVKGLGEALVSGKANPNKYIINHDKDKIIEKNQFFIFDEDILFKIAGLGRKIESHFNQPMDIEFAVKNKEVFVLQARPITTILT